VRDARADDDEPRNAEAYRETKNMNPIIRFLKRDGAKDTWRYERPVILAIELLCLIAGIWAAPDARARVWLAITLPLALLAAELTRASRSGATRKAELAAAQGNGIVLLCEADLVRAAKKLQLITATAPIVALGATVANTGLAGLTRAAVVGFVVSVVRYASVEVYGVWRAWYRARVPVQVDPTPLQSAALDDTPCATCRVDLGCIGGKEPTAIYSMNGQWYCACCWDNGAGVPIAATLQAPAELATTKPFDSGQMARAVEEVFREKQ
jgi:hypothetical protein